MATRARWTCTYVVCDRSSINAATASKLWWELGIASLVVGDSCAEARDISDRRMYRPHSPLVCYPIGLHSSNSFPPVVNRRGTRVFCNARKPRETKTERH